MSFQQTIFLIDRDVAANELLARNFEAHEFMVHTATTAEELLQMVRTKRADLIILGVDLPDMDGRDACRLLRKRGLLTPVLIVSDAASDAETILGLDSGANDYIVKPVKFPSLLARVRAHLRTSEANSNAVIRIGLCEFQPADRVIVGADRSRHLKAVDPDGRELALSVGCFMENLETAAGHYGFEIEKTAMDSSRLSPEILRLEFRKCSSHCVSL